MAQPNTNTQKAPTEPDAGSLTFGGMIPTDQPLESGSASLEDPVQPPEKFSIIDDDSKPALLGEVNRQRTAKIQFALGADAPSPDVISHALSTGNEASLREGAAAQKDAKDQADKVDYIKQVAAQGIPDDPKKQKVLENIIKSTPKNDPSTIFEKAYARAYTNLVQSIGDPQDSVVSQAAKVDMNHVANMADTAEVLISKQEIAKGAYETYEAAAKEQGWGGWTVDRLKEFGSFGLYNWYKVNDAVAPVPGILKGNNLSEQIQYLYTLPPEQMHQALHDTLDRLSRDNPQLAAEFAASAVSFSQTDQFVANLGNVADVVLFPFAGKVTMSAVQVSKKLATEGVAQTAKEGATVAYQAAVRANASVKTSVADLLSKMGDVGSAAVNNATKRAETILTKGVVDEPLIPEEIGRRLPSLTNPQSLGDGSSFSATVTQRLTQSLENNAGKAQERIRQLTHITRDISEAAEIAVQEAKERLAERFPHPNNAVTDVAFEQRTLSRVEQAELKVKEREEAYREAKANYDAAAKQSGEERTNITLRKNAAEKQKILNQIEFELRDAEKAAALTKELSERILARKNPRSTGTYEIVPGDIHPSNVTHVSTFIGDRTGEGFDSMQVAYGWGSKVYKLGDKDFNIEQRGAKYFIKVTTPVDETSSAVRAAKTISTEAQTPQGLVHSFFGWLATGNSRVSQAQIKNRILATSASQGMVTIMKDMAKDIGVLSKNQRNRLTRIMEDNRAAIDPATDKPGMFHRNFGELEQAYQRLFGHSATEKEAKAYFSAVQLNDLDYGMRRWAQYRDRARQGIETFQVLDRGTTASGNSTFSKSQHFLGKVIDKLPVDAAEKHPGTVALHAQGFPARVMNLHEFTDPTNAAELKKLMDEGYKVIQTHNPSRTVLDKFGPSKVNFIITKDFERTSLANAPEGLSLPYRPGWHQEYEQGWFIKQSKLTRVEESLVDGTKRVTHHYDGDNTMLGFTTQAEAKRWLPKIEEARQILAGEKKGILDDFIKAELPMFKNEAKFKSLFEPVKDAKGNVTFEGFSKETPFVHTQSGMTSTDIAGLKDTLEQKVGSKIQDNIRSPWNLMSEEQKRFVGQRDAPLWTIKEGMGSEGQPAFSLVDAPLIDPLSSLSRGMWDIMRNKYIVDYKTSAVEQWMSEFGHLLKGPVSKEDMWANATTHIHEGSFVDSNAMNFNQLMAAKQSRRALLEFIGTKGVTGSAIDTLKQKAADIIYAGTPIRVSDVINPWLLSTTTDPVRLMQGFAFHTSFFMNAYQGIQNAMVMANAIAIGGLKSGFEGFKGGYAFQLLRMNRGEAGLEAAARVSGWNKEHLKEAYEGFINTGRAFVEGEHDWKADLAGPKFFESVRGTILDKGQFFFREGERLGRTAGWTTAYHEWRAANPSAIFDASAQAKVLARSDDMTANMTRASRAAWQQGIFSIPTQFWAWNARNMELMVGRWQNGLSMGERARLVGMNSILYGVPLGGLAPSTAGFINAWDEVRQGLVDRGWDVNDRTFDSIYSGLTGMAYHLATGRPGNLNETLGIGGSNLLKDAFSDNKTLYQWLTGVSGTRIADAIGTVKPFARSLVGAMGLGDGKEYPITAKDFVDVARNVKIADTGVRTYMALQTGKYITKNGLYATDMSPTEAWISALTNATPRAATDAKAMQDVAKHQDKAIKEAAKEIKKNVTAAVQAAIDGNKEMHDVYMKRVGVLCEAADIPMDKRLQICISTADDVKPMSEKVPYEFWIKNAPPSKADARYKAWQNNTAQPVGK